MVLVLSFVEEWKTLELDSGGLADELSMPVSSINGKTSGMYAWQVYNSWWFSKYCLTCIFVIC